MILYQVSSDCASLFDFKETDHIMFLRYKALKIRNKFVRILATILNRIGNTT